MLSIVLKRFFKLSKSSVYGKTMDNLRKRVKVELLNNAKGYRKCVSKSSFVSQMVFTINFVAIDEIKPLLTFDQQIYVEFSILD